MSQARSPAWNPYTVNDGKTGYMELLFPADAAQSGKFSVDENGNVIGNSFSGMLTLQAATTVAGYTLVNGTGNVITWTTPNDGKLHRFMLFYSMDITSNETGGAISVTFTSPGGTSVTYGILPASQNAGWNFGETPAFSAIAKANTTVAIAQTTALTAGAAKLQAEIWGL